MKDPGSEGLTVVQGAGPGWRNASMKAVLASRNRTNCVYNLKLSGSHVKKKSKKKQVK